MKPFILIVGIVAAAAGCSGPRIISATSNEIVVEGIPSAVAAAGAVASKHCDAQGKKSSYKGQLGVYAHRFECE